MSKKEKFINDLKTHIEKYNNGFCLMEENDSYSSYIDIRRKLDNGEVEYYMDWNKSKFNKKILSKYVDEIHLHQGKDCDEYMELHNILTEFIKPKQR